MISWHVALGCSWDGKIWKCILLSCFTVGMFFTNQSLGFLHPRIFWALQTHLFDFQAVFCAVSHCGRGLVQMCLLGCIAVWDGRWSLQPFVCVTLFAASPAVFSMSVRRPQALQSQQGCRWEIARADFFEEIITGSVQWCRLGQV